MRCCWHIFELMGRFKGTFSTLYDDDSCQTRKEVRSRIWSLIEVWRMGGYSRLWPTIIAGRTFILFVTWAECACTVGTYSHNCPVLKYWEQNGNCRLGKFFKLIGDSLEMHFEKSNNMRQQCDHDSMGIQKKKSIDSFPLKFYQWRTVVGDQTSWCAYDSRLRPMTGCYETNPPVKFSLIYNEVRWKRRY